MAAFSHTASAPSAKAVCLLDDVIDITYLYLFLLLFYFSERHSSWSRSNKIEFCGMKILGLKTD